MRELITTLCHGREIELLWQPELNEIPEYIEKGFVPVEMSEGSHSFVDFRELDHHNELSDRPSASITAMKFYGDLANETTAHIMVNHADADCVVTGLTLLGLLPKELHEKLNPEIGLADTVPIGLDYSKLKFGGHIQVWKKAMQSIKQSGWSWLYGLSLWLEILERPELYQKHFDKLNEEEAERIRLAREDYSNAVISKSGRVVLVMPSRVKGYEVYFQRQNEFPDDALQGWKHWCVIAVPDWKESKAQISCPNIKVAEAAFGAGGLKNVFDLLPKVDGKEWGGRETVGGSPRGVEFPRERITEVLEIIDSAVKGE